jgi:hypothetical protein
MEQLIAEYWGQILAVGILAALITPKAVSLWLDYQNDKRTCGAGCICAGENVRERQQQSLAIQAQQPVYGQQSAPPVIQAPAQAYQQQPQATPIIIIQQPAPQMMQPQQQHIIYVQGPQGQPVYQPHPAPGCLHRAATAGPTASAAGPADSIPAACAAAVSAAVSRAAPGRAGLFHRLHA